jgi:hypothetical protein
MPSKNKSDHESTLANDALWGAEAIARYIGQPLRKTRYLISTGALPVQKLGARTILARKSQIDKALVGAR